MKRVSVFLTALVCTLVWHSGFAAEDESELETIVVTASRLHRSAAELTQSVTTIERTKIDARQFANVTELLRQIAGINVIQQGGRG